MKTCSFLALLRICDRAIGIADARPLMLSTLADIHGRLLEIVRGV